MKTLNDKDKDILVEVATIGLGNAISPISKIIFQKIDFKVPHIDLCKLENCQQLIGEADDPRVVAMVSIEEELSGSFLLVLKPEDAKKMALSVGGWQTNQVIEEIANIVAGASLTALSKLLKLSLKQSVPASANDMLRAIVNQVLTTMGESSDEVLFMGTDFEVENLGVEGKVALIFNPISTDKILSKTWTK